MPITSFKRVGDFPLGLKWLPKFLCREKKPNQVFTRTSIAVRSQITWQPRGRTLPPTHEIWCQCVSSTGGRATCFTAPLRHFCSCSSSSCYFNLRLPLSSEAAASTFDLCSLSGPPESGAPAACSGPARTVSGFGTLGRQSGAFLLWMFKKITIATLHPVLSTGGRERHVSFKHMPLIAYIIISLLKGNMKLSLFSLI